MKKELSWDLKLPVTMGDGEQNGLAAVWFLL